MMGYSGSGNDPSLANRVAAVETAMPAAATTMPPAVADAGAKGATTQRYALEDHTHASKARKAIISVSADGVITWTFAVPFDTGVVPICNAIAICPAGTTDIVNVQQEGDATNTQVSFRVARFQRSVVALLGLTILSLNAGVPANTKLSLLALQP